MRFEFDTKEEYILEDECVLLRPLRRDDFGHLLTFSLHEPEIWKYSLLQAGGEDNLAKYIHQALTARDQGKEYPFIVFDKRSQEFAGSTRFYDIQLTYQTLQLGYTWYGKKFQGSGLNRHCKYLLLQFAFEQIGMKRVEFRADNQNSKSIAAMKGIGCVEEGVLRSHMPTHGSEVRRDSIVLSILKGEWENEVKEKIVQKIQSSNVI